MMDYEKIWNFENLYKAHKKARLGKRSTKEVIDFELDLAKNLSDLSDSLRNKSYTLGGYYEFTVYDPKVRHINALHYRDRVVQHCLCDEVLEPLLEKRLIHDNAACRKEKGTHFAIKRLSRFLGEYYKQYGASGYILKCDIKKFFDNIDHDILKRKLWHLKFDSDTLELLYHIIDSYEVESGKGLPMGNQTSQWFAIYYLDGLDRFIKEKLRVKYYSRYMDDCVMLESDKNRLKEILTSITKYIEEELLLEFNAKTQITAMKNGVRYLGWHFYLLKSGKIIRRVVDQTKYNYKRKLKKMQAMYAADKMELDDVKQVLASYRAHLSHGHSYRLQEKLCYNFVLKKTVDRKEGGSMPYKIDVNEVGKYIEYLKKVKKKLESDLADFDKFMKDAHNYWDDNNYNLTIQSKEKVASEQKKLIEAIDRSLKKLRQMHEEYERYLKRK